MPRLGSGLCSLCCSCPAFTGDILTSTEVISPFFLVFAQYPSYRITVVSFWLLDRHMPVGASFSCVWLSRGFIRQDSVSIGISRHQPPFSFFHLTLVVESWLTLLVLEEGSSCSIVSSFGQLYLVTLLMISCCCPDRC